jgi:hypothetical protein
LNACSLQPDGVEKRFILEIYQKTVGSRQSRGVGPRVMRHRLRMAGNPQEGYSSDKKNPVDDQ